MSISRQELSSNSTPRQSREPSLDAVPFDAAAPPSPPSGFSADTQLSGTQPSDMASDAQSPAMHSDAEADGQAALEAENPAGKTRILIVEDDEEIRAALHDALDDLGYDALEEPDAEHALLALAESDFDALLVDVRMPGMGGIALCRHLASDGPRLPVIVMTAFGDVDTAVEALRAGAYDFITKPISITEVARVIERGIAEHPRSAAMARLKEPAQEPTVPGASTAGASTGGGVSTDGNLGAPVEHTLKDAAAQVEPDSAAPEAASLEEVERRHIEVVLRAVGWNKARAARELGIDRSTLYRKLIRLGLTRPR